MFESDSVAADASSAPAPKSSGDRRRLGGQQRTCEHDDRRRDDPPDSPSVEGASDPPGARSRARAPGDQVPGQDEEDVHADVPAGQATVTPAWYRTIRMTAIDAVPWRSGPEAGVPARLTGCQNGPPGRSGSTPRQPTEDRPA